jgi:GT2 family glycosyltransferase
MNPLLVSATKATTMEEFSSRPIHKYIEKTGINTNIALGCTEGLSLAYNARISANNDIIIFVHDDVEIEDLWLLEKIESTDADVVVCAGATSFNKNKMCLAWHLAAEKREDLRGEVAHRFPNGQVNTTIFGPAGRVLTFDGVFMAIKTKNILEKGVAFDERFKWHFYDTAFALRCHKAGLKAAISPHPIRIVHHGLGDSMHSEEFNQSQELFKTTL